MRFCLRFTRSMKKFNHISGYTIVEIAVVLSIIGIVASLAVPSFRSMLLSDNVSSLNNELLISLKRARSEAIARGNNITMCSSTDGMSCSGSAGNWEQGWIVFEDRNNDGSVTADEMIWVQDMEATQGVSVTASPSFESQLIYSRNGTLAGGVAGFFRTCSGLGTLDRRDIDVDVSGAPVYRLREDIQC